ncbi:MAG: precorrin-4 C(11)-methyltransferase [Clostridia bacterium]|nr:precorrin-4 C(11)-methyltransferase [Clostridia bacterium]MBQ3869013.1 precorrin-4 C(11)-methyltransferase [Clostridia bacterium]
MVHIVGAGCGAPDLITLRGKAHIENADVIIYAGSLVNKELLKFAKRGCAIHDSAKMTLEEITAVMTEAEAKGLTTVRLHTGDPSLYGAIGEQMREMDKLGIEYDITPGVSSFSGAAAALKTEYTLPDVSQTVIITRAAGKTPVPEKEALRSLASHGATMVLFLSAGLLKEAEDELIAGGYPPDAPAAIVYKASWEDEKVCRCTVGTLQKTARENGIKKTAIITVGGFLQSGFARSHLYDPDFSTEFREAKK